MFASLQSRTEHCIQMYIFIHCRSLMFVLILMFCWKCWGSGCRCRWSCRFRGNNKLTQCSSSWWRHTHAKKKKKVQIRTPKTYGVFVAWRLKMCSKICIDKSFITVHFFPVWYVICIIIITSCVTSYSKKTRSAPDNNCTLWQTHVFCTNGWWCSWETGFIPKKKNTSSHSVCCKQRQTTNEKPIFDSLAVSRFQSSEF